MKTTTTIALALLLIAATLGIAKAAGQADHQRGEHKGLSTTQNTVTGPVWQGGVVIIKDNGQCGVNHVGFGYESVFLPNISNTGGYSHFSTLYGRSAGSFQPTKSGRWRSKGEYRADGVSFNGWNFSYTGRYLRFKTVPSTITASTKTFVMYVTLKNYNGRGPDCAVRMRGVYGQRP